jgi:4-amino-4-deoxy-L-arabinose transferase-like glycosyltransferase
MNSKRILLKKESDNSREISTIFRFCLIAGIFVLAGALRLNHINQPLVDIFSFRETSTAMMAENFSHGNWNIFLPQVNWAGPGPTYTGREFQTFTYLVAIIWAVVGQHDWIGRTIAVAFGFISLSSFYFLVRRVWGESYALAGAVVWAVLPGAVAIDRCFLPDPAMLGLVLASLLCYMIFLQAKRFGYLYLAAGLGVLGIFTKLPGAVVIAPMVYATVTLLSREAGEEKRKLLRRIIFVALISTISVATYYLWVLHVAKTYPPYHLAGIGNFLWSPRKESWFSSQYFIPEAFRVLTRWLWTWPGIILALIGLVESFSVARFNVRESESHYAPWLFHWWLAGCLVLYIVAAYELVWNPWNFHVFNVVAAAFAGRALILIGRIPWFGKSPTMILLKISIPLIALTCSSIWALQLFWRLRPRSVDDYELGKALFRISQPGDLVATIPSEMGDPRVIYYSHRHGWVFPDPYRDWSMLSPDDDTSIQALEELRLQKTRWLGIARFPFDRRQPPRNFWKYHRKLIEYVERTCERTASNTHGTIYRILTLEELRNKRTNLAYPDRTH